MRNFINIDDANEDCMIHVPNYDQPLGESSMPSLECEDSYIDITHVEQSDDQGIIDNLSRNIGVVCGLGGKQYKIGINVRLLSALIVFMRKVIETDKLPYRIKHQANGRVRVDTYAKMACDMKLLPAFRQLAFNGLALSPDLVLFHRIHAAHPISLKHILFDSMTDQAVAEICNDFVATLRVEGERIGIKRMLKNWQRNANENAKRLTRYLNALHERYARLMVIRLDLMYRKAACLDVEHAMQLHELLQSLNAKERTALIQDEPIDIADELPRVDIFTATEDWRHFKGNMRGKPSLFRHLVGYVCSIEFSSTGGHHLHVALIFDGSQVKKHAWLGDQIGQYWIETTAGRGYFYNCNHSTYKHNGIGLIDYHDTEKRRNLMLALRYLAKKDQFVRVKASLKSKTFMTGHMPTPAIGRTGRPRTKGLPELPVGPSQRANDEQDALAA